MMEKLRFNTLRFGLWCGFFIFYVIVGAVGFMLIESPLEGEIRKELKIYRQTFLEKASCLTGNFRIHCNQEEFTNLNDIWRTDLNRSFKRRYLLNAVPMYGVVVNSVWIICSDLFLSNYANDCSPWSYNEKLNLSTIRVTSIFYLPWLALLKAIDISSIKYYHSERVNTPHIFG